LVSKTEWALSKKNLLCCAIYSLVAILAISVFRADTCCSLLLTLSLFLTREEFSRADAEKIREKSAAEGEARWVTEGSDRWNELLEQLG
jgi:hypothetical protein